MSRRLLGLPLLAAGLLLAAPPAPAAQIVAVAVASGRVFVGQVDRRSDDAHLWLVSVDRGVTLRRPIQWDHVVLARCAAGELSPNDLRALAAAQRAESESAAAETQELPAPADETIEELPRPRGWSPDRHLAEFIEAARANNTQVCSISIDVEVANWDATVEDDGIVVHLFPQNGLGQIVPVDGTLEIELIASAPPGSPQRPLPRIGRWTARVLPEQFGPSGAVLKFPFLGVQPDFHLDVGPMGLVHARLSVPGNGSFDASQSMVRIRPYSFMRDQAQQNEGRRFFDVERVNWP